jgi:MFS family permease
LGNPASAPARHDPYAALRIRPFRLFALGNTLSNLGLQMQTGALMWEVYQVTREPLALGGVGLVQWIPTVLLALPAGHLADRCDRRRVVLACTLAIACASLALAWVSSRGLGLWAMYGCILCGSIAKTLAQPAKAALVPRLVPMERFANAVTWNTSGFQLAAVAGPALQGAAIAAWHRPALVYLTDAAAALGFSLLLVAMGPGAASAPGSSRSSPVTWEEIAAGFRFVWRTRVLFAAITLDLFAVLLGGATALLPVYQHILGTSPAGLGWLQAAPAMGAMAMSLLLAHRPPLARAGRALLWAVTGYGLAIIVFGLSRHLWLSWSMLFLTGAFDTISVVVRHTLVQVLTPDSMRGRVSAVNGMFIYASNELGGFESGAMAHLTSPRFAVVSGGLGTLLVVAVVALLSPGLRAFGRLDRGCTPEAEREPGPEHCREKPHEPPPALEAVPDAAP